MKTVIVDDEFHSTALLSALIGRMDVAGIELVTTFNKPVEARDWIREHGCDLLLLDIEMPLLNGFDLVESLLASGCKPLLVFITAYDEHAVRAFRFSAFDFLLKPVDEEELRAVLIRALERRQQEQEMQFRFLRELYQQQAAPERMVLAVQEGYELVRIADIVHVDSDSNYSQVFIAQRKPVFLARTLKDFEQTLQEQGFMRIHNSHLVNLSHITRFIKADGGYVEMSDGMRLPVSRARRDDLIRYFEALRR
jgi:two-component system, LytTR family, response regulator